MLIGPILFLITITIMLSSTESTVKRKQYSLSLVIWPTEAGLKITVDDHVWTVPNCEVIHAEVDHTHSLSTWNVKGEGTTKNNI